MTDDGLAPVGGVAPGGTSPGGSGPAGRSGPPKGLLRQTSLSRLGHQARSILLPTVLAVVASALGAVASAAVVVVLLSQAGVGSAASDVSVTDCQQRTRQLGTALAAYRAAEGQDAGSWSDLSPYLDQVWPTHSIDFAASPPQVVVVEGGECDTLGATDGAVVSGSGDVVAGSTVASIALISGSVVLGSVALGVVVFFLLGWWLALAYRCLSPSDQRASPRRAFGPFQTYLVGSVAVTLVLLALTAADADPFAVLVFGGGAVLAFCVAMVISLRRWISMLGDVNFAFGRYTAPARLMRLSILWTFVLFVLYIVLAIVLPLTGAPVWVILTVLLSVLVLLAAMPVMGFVAFVVGVVLATTQIERTLSDAASQLEAIERQGWLVVNRRPQPVRLR